MRIVEEKPDPSVIKHVVCKMCGVRIEYVPIDIKEVKYRDYSGDLETYSYLDCPKCNNRIIIK